MAFGATFVNDSGAAVIDGTYKNMGLRVKQEFAVGAGGVYAVTIYNAVAPILFINCTGYAGFYRVVESGSTFTFYIKAASGGVCTAYIFDVPAPTVSTYGMVVKNAAGVTIFNTESNYLRIVDFFGVYGSPNTPGYFPSYTRTYPSGKYAVAIGVPRTRYPYNEQGYVDGINTTATAINLVSNVPVLTAEQALVGTSAIRDGFTTYAMTANVTGY